ncbi:MAG: Transcriptional regulator, LysR family [Labilithrix sp.]|nr:Transcriptional regulator, LysR family [Labilithrix sp.]
MKSPRSLDNEALVGDVHDLRAFAFAADLQSLGEAAKLMGESKATLSRRIARLEASLGIALLHRTPRGVAATSDGSTYRTRIAEVLDLLGDANAAVRQAARAEPSGNLRLTVAPGFESMLAPALARFASAYPEVVVTTMVTERFVDLEAEHLDVALRVARTLGDSPLVAHRLVELDFVLVAAPDYLAERKVPKRASDLANHRHVRLGPPRMETPTVLEHAEGGAPLTLDFPPSISATNVGFAKELAVAGAGVALLPTLVVERDIEEGRLVRLLRPYVFRGASLYLLHRGGRLVPSKVRVFREFMIEEFRRRCGEAIAGKQNKV